MLNDIILILLTSGFIALLEIIGLFSISLKKVNYSSGLRREINCLEKIGRKNKQLSINRGSR